MREAMSVISRTGRLLLLAALLSASAWQASAQSEARAWLGVWVSNLAYREGAFVARVDAQGPAAAATIRQGDVIVAVDAQAVRNMAELTCLLQARKPGDTVKLALLRRGAHHVVDATLGRWPDRAPPPRGDCADAISGKAGGQPAA
jgi:S1-C subfamily serine protease